MIWILLWACCWLIALALWAKESGEIYLPDVIALGTLAPIALLYMAIMIGVDVKLWEEK